MVKGPPMASCHRSPVSDETAGSNAAVVAVMDVWVFSVATADWNGPTTLGSTDHSPGVSGEPMADAVTSRPWPEATSGSPAGVLMSNWIGSVPSVVASAVIDVVWLGTRY